MIWISVAFVGGFALACYLGQEERRFQAKQRAKLLRELYDAREEVANLMRMLHGHGEDWK